MHPAHTLPAGTVTAGAGVSDHLLLGPGRRQLDAAADTDSESAYFSGALAQSLFSPGLAPWVGARVGIGLHSEAGVTYTRRGVRVDARHAFETDRIALSLGLGGSVRLSHAPDYSAEQPSSVEPSGELPGWNDDGVTGLGVDVPVLLGYRSRARLLELWTGVRLGVDRMEGTLAWQVAGPGAEEAKLDAVRWFMGPLLGLKVGVDPLWAAVEVGLAYQSGDATLDRDASDLHADVEGLTLTPTGVLGARF
jgi:hypothetical protein